MEKLLTPEQVCELFEIKLSYLYNLTYRELIPHFKLGGMLRFRQSELETWLTEQYRQPLVAAEEGVRYGRA